MTGVTQRQLRSMPVGLRISLNDKIETQKYCEEEKHENSEKNCMAAEFCADIFSGIWKCRFEGGGKRRRNNF